jgi:hypothetical protein
MKTGLLHLHGLLPWLLIILPVIAIIISLIKEKNEEVTGKPHKLVLFTLIFSHIQLLVGLALWVIAWMNKDASVNVMKESIARKNLIEHPITMILAVVFITIGYSKAKRATNGRKRANAVAVFFGLAIVCMLAMNHWDKMAFLK